MGPKARVERPKSDDSWSRYTGQGPMLLAPTVLALGGRDTAPNDSAMAAKTPAAPTRKMYRARGGHTEKLLSYSAKHGAGCRDKAAIFCG